MLIVILTYVLQLILIVHAIRNHKRFGWIWLLVFVPALGGVAYVIVEILPSLNVRNRGTKVMNAVFPARLVEAAARQYAVTPTPHNKRQLAEAYVAAGDTDRAIPLYQELVDGWYQDDIGVLTALATAYRQVGVFDNAFALFTRVAQSETALPRNTTLMVNYTGYRATGEDRYLEWIERYFAGNGDLETGYYLVDVYVNRGRGADAQKVIASMKERATVHTATKHRIDTSWITKAERLHRSK